MRELAIILAITGAIGCLPEIRADSSSGSGSDLDCEQAQLIYGLCLEVEDPDCDRYLAGVEFLCQGN